MCAHLHCATGLHLAEGHLDRIQVRGIFGQEAKRRPARFDGLSDTGGLVRWKIVEHHDVVALEGRGETAFDIRQEAPSVHCPVDCTWCRHAILAQSGNESSFLCRVYRQVDVHCLPALADFSAGCRYVVHRGQKARPVAQSVLEKPIARDKSRARQASCLDPSPCARSCIFAPNPWLLMQSAEATEIRCLIAIWQIDVSYWTHNSLNAHDPQILQKK